MLDKGGIQPRLLVSGLPRTGEAPREVSVRSLGAKVLCERHNSALSPLDEEFYRLHRLLTCDGDEWPRTVDEKVIGVFNGLDLQKAMIKLALARVAGGLATSQDGLVQMSSKYMRLIPALFGRRTGIRGRLTHPFGLYACDGVGRNGDGRMALESVPLAVRGRNYGDYLDIQGLRLALLLAWPPFDIAAFLGRIHYRPISIELTRVDGDPVVVAVGWGDQPAPVLLASA